MGSCLFCDIVEGQIPCTEVYSDDEFLAFADIDPKAPTHVLIIPRRHVASLTDLTEVDAGLAGRLDQAHEDRGAGARRSRRTVSTEEKILGAQTRGQGQPAHDGPVHHQRCGQRGPHCGSIATEH